jgi:hypothetical protein
MANGPQDARDWLDAIVAEVAVSSGTAAGEVRVTVEPVTWPDGSLGCPDPGMMYTQALVEGYRVTLLAGDLTYDYRVGRGGHFRRCGPTRPKSK